MNNGIKKNEKSTDKVKIRRSHMSQHVSRASQVPANSLSKWRGRSAHCDTFIQTEAVSLVLRQTRTLNGRWSTRPPRNYLAPIITKEGKERGDTQPRERPSFSQELGSVAFTQYVESKS